MNILITGSQGFIGSYFKTKYMNLHNISTFSFRNDNFSSLSLSKIDVIIHMSALVHQMNGASKEEYEKINVQQTMDLAKKAKEEGVSHFIFMSTIAVYGMDSGTLDENTICDPISDYGKSKFKAEEKLREIETDSFKLSIIRPPIVNGYNAPGNMKSLIKLVKKVPILPFGNINNKRSMVYVGNLCHMINEIIKQEKIGIFLSSDNDTLSTTELIELISKALEKKTYLIEIIFFDKLLRLLKGSLYNRLFGSLVINNISSMDKLNLANPYSVEDGIKFMICGED